MDTTAPPNAEAGVAVAPPADEPGVAIGDADLAPVRDPIQAPASATGSENLSGKLNNLVTSDLDNITAGRDFLLVGMFDHMLEGVVSNMIMQDFQPHLRSL